MIQVQGNSVVEEWLVVGLDLDSRPGQAVEVKGRDLTQMVVGA